MAIDLPAPVAAFFAGKHRHDIDAIAAPFAADAWVHDEHNDHRGRAAVRAWIEDTQRKYADVATPEEVTAEGKTVVVRALVSGNFPGSPIRLTHRFKLAGGEIVELAIG
jgi:hypothetical protein